MLNSAKKHTKESMNLIYISFRLDAMGFVSTLKLGLRRLIKTYHLLVSNKDLPSIGLSQAYQFTKK